MYGILQNYIKLHVKSEFIIIGKIIDKLFASILIFSTRNKYCFYEYLLKYIFLKFIFDLFLFKHTFKDYNSNYKNFF